EVVGPVVVRARDEPRADHPPAVNVTRHQFVPAVTAHVVEPAQYAVLSAYEQYRVVARADRASGAGLGQLDRAPDTEPTAGEQRAPFPGEYGFIGVRGPGKHGAAALKARPNLFKIQRRGHSGHLRQSSGLVTT